MKLFYRLSTSFFAKGVPYTKHNWHCTTGFLINTAPLNVYWVIGLNLLEKINSIYFLVTWNLSESIFYIRISTKKQAFDFLKRNSYTNVCLQLLCDAKLMTSLLIFLISSKNLKWKQDFHTADYGITNFWILLFGGAKYQRGKEAETRGTKSNHYLINHNWYHVEKLAVFSSSNLKAQHKVLC